MTKSRDDLRTGIGLRLPHLAVVAATRPTANWLEIHPENFLANPHARELLEEIADHYAISVHTVGVSIGSAGGIDAAHLKRVRALVDRLDPVLVSGHLAWSTHKGAYLNDLLPLPYNEQVLDLLVRHVGEVQDGLGRRYLVENPSTYVGIRGSIMTEPEFLGELAQRTGCGLLCDVSNIHVSGTNLGFDPVAYLEAFPAEQVAEMHLGGYTPEADPADPGAELLIDTHAAPIADPAWRLYARAVARFGATPTLIEWDSALPPFATLQNEAAKADTLAAAVLGWEVRHARAG